MDLNTGKLDDSEGFKSDHCIHGTTKLYVISSLLYTSLLLHCFSPDTTIPIPKDNGRSLSTPNNYWAIALSVLRLNLD